MTLKLKAENRDIFGKKLKFLRKEGKVPAVIYGGKKESISISVPLKEFKKTWKEAGESTVIELIMGEEKTPLNVIIKEVVIDPLNDEPIHADFYKVEMDKPITATVPIVFEGIAIAVKELGGVLVKVMHEIEIEALPKDMPSEIVVDISQLKTFEDKITVDDLDLPYQVKANAKIEEVVALVEEPRAEEEPVKEMTIEDIEVEKKGKKEEPEEEGSAAEGEPRQGREKKEK